MIDEQFRVYSEQLVEKIFIMIVCWLPDGAPGNITHGVHAVGFQLFRIAPAHTPEVCQWTVGPEGAAVAHFIKLRDADAVFIRGDMFRLDVHGNLTEIQVRADSRRGCDAGGLQHIQNHFHGQLPGRDSVCFQIVRHIHENLVDGIDMNILRCDISQIDIVNVGAAFHIMGHPGRCSDIVCR